MKTFYQFVEMEQSKIGYTPVVQNQQSNESKFNNRSKFMIRAYNAATNSKLPETEESYNEIGRSDGYLNTLTDKRNFFKFFKYSPEFKNWLANSNTWSEQIKTMIFNGLDDEARKNIAYTIAMGISRGLPNTNQ